MMDCYDCLHRAVCMKPGRKCSEYISQAVIRGQPLDCCFYNDGVSCSSQNQCESCGWNPNEVARRKQILRDCEATGETPHVSL